MDFLATSLEPIHGLSIHWSSDCNMACKYCYIEKKKKEMASYNRKIREALKDGSFIANIKRVCASKKDDFQDLSLWGAEPSINGDLFAPFLQEIFDFFPRMSSLMFSSNALLGGEFIFKNFYIPLKEYAEKNQRHIRFDFQLSLDGPAYINDDSRHDGATQSTLETIEYFCKNVPQDSPYLELVMITKPTMDTSYMKQMNERGLEAFYEYFGFFNDVQQKALKDAKNKHNIRISVVGIPTIVDPGYHTIEDGKILAEWISYLPKIDKNRIPAYHNKPLFSQPLQAVEKYFEFCHGNPLATGYNVFSCSAGKNNVTIDYEGNLYTCNRLCKNAALEMDEKYKHTTRLNTNLFSDDKTWMKQTWANQLYHDDLLSRRYMFDQLRYTMALAGQIDKKYLYDSDAATLLFYSMMGFLCHVGIEEDLTQCQSLLPTSYFKLIGNGALDAMIEYYKTEMARGEMPQWKTVM